MNDRTNADWWGDMMSRNDELTYRERSRRARRARARYVDRCRMILAGVIGMIVVCTAFSAYALRSRASSNDGDISYKYYKNIVIAYDYDLQDAAADYADEHYDNERDYLREVCNINHLASATDVTPGTHVIVPYYAEEFR